ncbi:hypothetical protein [Lacrimispora defluvii]|uniref:Uncharacterized protein n=1 Tax=Lacrimispora defluvii TaxID=2719233 RepID=A0ABX1VQV4_9FIRM|nr:hypothetical protein [Lacrimispora defluvii]NNJ30489.1 hypothetical protein [Lacrimispora defluvii]
MRVRVIKPIAAKEKKLKVCAYVIPQYILLNSLVYRNENESLKYQRFQGMGIQTRRVFLVFENRKSTFNIPCRMYVLPL